MRRVVFCAKIGSSDVTLDSLSWGLVDCNYRPSISPSIVSHSISSPFVDVTFYLIIFHRVTNISIDSNFLKNLLDYIRLFFGNYNGEL